VPVAYLDHAATTPVVPEAIAALTAAMVEVGNPQSLHGAGRRARALVEESRERVAAALGARPGDVVFTAGGTESDNLAVKGGYWARRAADPARVRLVISAVEHHAVLDAAAWLAAEQGAQVTLVEVDAWGRVRPEALERALHADGGPATVALVSIMWANNEVGTVNDIATLAAVAHEHGAPMHSDAVQAVGQLPVDMTAAGVDALTLSGHKLGGPPGSGALLVQRELGLQPLLHGGASEREARAGTLDVPGIAGLAAATVLAVREQSQRAARLVALRDELVDAVTDACPEAVLNGDPHTRLPGNAHLGFPGCEGDALLLLLDAAGVHCSTGSACTAGVAQPSHVLLAMGATPEAARGSLRFSLGHTSTAADVRAVADAIGPAVARARRAGLLHAPRPR